MARHQWDVCPMDLKVRFQWGPQVRCRWDPLALWAPEHPVRCRWDPPALWLPEHAVRCPCAPRALPPRQQLPDRWFRDRQVLPRGPCLRQQHAVACHHHAMAMHPTSDVAGPHGVEAAILSITGPGETRTSHGVPRAGSATGDRSLEEKDRVSGSTGMITRMVSVTCGMTC